jgi:elongation factor Ts
MEISADQIKNLREETGAGFLDVKKALQESNGDIDKAKAALRLIGVKIAAKKQERTAGQGIVHSYIHGDKLGVLVELRCETDFVAASEPFRQVARDLGLHIAASAPQYLRPDDIPASVIDAERQIYQQQVATEGKSADIATKIVEGKLAKFYTQVCLLNQPFVKDDSITVAQVIEQLTAKVGEKIEIGDFYRLQLGAKG